MTRVQHRVPAVEPAPTRDPREDAELRELRRLLRAGALGGGSGGVTDGDKGDIVVSGAGTNWTIDAGVIDTTKLGGDITPAGVALLDDASAAAQRTTLGLGTAATQPSTAFAAATHTHVIADTTGLQAALDGKAALAHTHPIADVTGLQTALDGKAALVHTHAIADVTGLAARLAATTRVATATVTPAAFAETTVTVSDADATVDKPVVASLIPNADFDADDLTDVRVIGQSLAGQIAFTLSRDGPLVGTYAIAYSIAA